MARFFHPLLTLIASATDRELAKYVQFLKEENKILRARLPERLVATDQEKRRLLRFFELAIKGFFCRTASNLAARLLA